MAKNRVVFLCPSFDPYWVQIFDALNERLGSKFTVITQSFHSAKNTRIAQHMGNFRRKIVSGRRVSISDRRSEGGHGTPFGLNIAPTLPFVLARISPQVVITSNFSLWTIASILMRFPTVIFWEGTHHTERTVKPWRLRLRRWIARNAKAFVVNGTAAKAYVCDVLDVCDSEVFFGSLCSSQPPEGVIEKRSQSQPAKRPINFVFVGRLIKGKGADHLIEAAALLCAKLDSYDQFTITIVGGGEERDNLEELARNRQIATCVRFVGETHPTEVWQHYADGDVFVLPTLHDNWPLVVLEAMSVGMPVLLSRFAGSVPELIAKDRNGYSFDPHDHHQLANFMEIYIKTPRLVNSHGAISRKMAMEHNPLRTSEVFVAAATFAVSGASEP